MILKWTLIKQLEIDSDISYHWLLWCLFCHKKFNIFKVKSLESVCGMYFARNEMKSQNELDFQVITKFKKSRLSVLTPPPPITTSGTYITNQSTVISHCKQHKVPKLITLKNCARCPGTSEWSINHLWVLTDEDQYRNLGVFPFIDLNCTSLTGILIKKNL